ncbi:D-Ala-D-Ala carboxypeptidase family metallohydrolase [Verrucomicrobiaceae bacterium 227]
MNFREFPLSRRHLLVGGATLAASFATASLQFRRPQKPQTTRQLPNPGPVPAPIPPRPQEVLVESMESVRPHYLRHTEPHEEQYAHFIHSLGLNHIAPFELLRVHRNCHRGVHNCLPPEQLWQQMGETLKIADELRTRLDRKMLLITSAYRSPEYNRVIPGSASRSYHTKNCALDLVYDCPPAHALKEAKAMRREGRFKGGLGLYSSFIHLDTRGSNAIWSRA